MKFIVFLPIVFLSFTIQAMTGFGSIIIAVTLGSLFFPIKEILPVLVILDFLLNSYILSRYFREIDWGILFKKILPAMSVGFVIGQIIFNTVGADSKRLFGAVVTALAIFELYNFYRKNEKPLSSISAILFLFAAGIIHGIYASSGPLVVYVVGKLGIDRTTFRSTLDALWVLMDILLILSYAFSGILTTATLIQTLYILPVIVVGLMLGEYLHHRVNERMFRGVIFYLLLFTGISILIWG